MTSRETPATNMGFSAIRHGGHVLAEEYILIAPFAYQV